MMMGAGGVFGALVGGYIMEKNPNLIFMIYSIYGLIVVILGYNLNEKEEAPSEEGLCARLSTSLGEMK